MFRIFVNAPFVLLLFVAGIVPALAADNSFYCRYEPGTDFGSGIDFQYDFERNIVQLEAHHNGAYSVDFTLGEVLRTAKNLQFEFEYWRDGTVNMRETQSLNYDAMTLRTTRYFYGDDRTQAVEGQTAIATCLRGTSAHKTAPNEVDTSSNESSGKSVGQSATPAAEIACHTQELKGEGPQSVTYCLASQLPAQKEYSYGPENLAQAEGAWCEGEVGNGIGVGVELSFQPHGNGAQPPSYDRLLIANGYDKTTRTFIENTRVKQIEIKSDDAFGGQTWVRTLRDETGVQEVLLGAKVRPYGVLITILDVYPGQKYDDTCLSFIGADFGF